MSNCVNQNSVTAQVRIIVEMKVTLLIIAVIKKSKQETKQSKESSLKNGKEMKLAMKLQKHWTTAK